MRGAVPLGRPLSLVSTQSTRRAMNKDQLQQLSELKEKVHELRGYL